MECDLCEKEVGENYVRCAVCLSIVGTDCCQGKSDGEDILCIECEE